MDCDALQVVAAKLVLGLTGPDDLPEIAVGALERGCDSPTLRILAGVKDADPADNRQLLKPRWVSYRTPCQATIRR